MKTPGRMPLRTRVACLSGSLVLAFLAGLTFPLPGATAASPSEPGEALIAVDYASLVGGADLDFKMPLGPGAERGLPIGNGRVGTLLWTRPEQSKLHMQINHTDVFAFRNSSAATLDAHAFYCNGCGFVDIDVGDDAFGDHSTSNHLAVYDAVAEVSGRGVRIRAFAWNQKDVIAVEITDDRDEPRPISVDLRMLRPPEVKSGPHSAISSVAAIGQDIELTQEFREKADQPLALDLNSLSTLRARVIGRAAAASKVNDRTMRLTTPAGKGTLTVLFSLGQSKENTVEQVKRAAEADLEEAATAGFVKLLDDNMTYWHDFWSKSFVSMSGSPELEEMTRLSIWNLYIAGSCQRGNFPAKFNGLIFVSTGDVRDWGQNFWWFNQSCQHGWEYAANHEELLEPVFRWNMRNFAAYANSAQRSWNSRGWYIPETSCWDGPELLPEGVHKPRGQRQPMMSLVGGGWTSRNTYNMSKFTGLYYKKYLYTGDERWLKEWVYPAARATAEFYCGLKAGCQDAGGDDNGPEGIAVLRKDADGKYHLYGTELHEHIWWGKDIIEDLAGIRGVFPLAIALSEKYGVDADQRAEWQEVLDNLAPYPRSDMAGAISGLGPGTWAQGLAPHGKLRGNEGDESPRMGPVRGDFDVLTLESADTDEWAVAMATLDKHPGTVKGHGCGVGSYPILPGRMGRPDLVERALPRQMAISPETARVPRAESFTSQGMGIFAQAVQSALLLSIAPSPTGDPVIRLMEGWPRKWDVSFKLQAEGGFLISSAMKGGTIRFVEILSQRGGECRIRNPWPTDDATLFCMGRKTNVLKGGLLTFPTEAGQTYLLVTPRCWTTGAASTDAVPAELGRIEELRTVVPHEAAESARALPPRDRFHVYLLMGQSNMAGRGKLDPATRVSSDRVLKYTSEEGWAPGTEPLHASKSGKGGAGLAASFARAMADAEPDVYSQLVEDCLTALPGHAPCTAVVESAGLTAKQDKLHFGTPALREFGIRYAAAMQRLQQSK